MKKYDSKKRRLNELEQNLFFRVLSKIYYTHLDHDYKFNALSRLTEMVIYHEITEEQVLSSTKLFINSIESSDLDFKKQGSRAITELIHRNYDLISQGDADLIYNKLYALYLLNDNPDVKHNIIWGINRLIEVRLISQDMIKQLYKTFLQIAKSEDHIPTGVLKALIGVIEYRIDNDIDYQELLEVFKKYAKHEDVCHKRDALGGISSLIEYQLIAKPERENLTKFLIEATQDNDKIVQGNGLTCICFLAINNDITQDNEAEVVNLLKTFERSDYAYSVYSSKQALKGLTKIKSDSDVKKHKSEVIIHNIKSPFEFPIKVSSSSVEEIFEFALRLDTIRQSLNNEMIELKIDINSITQIEKNEKFLQNKCKLRKLYDDVYKYDSNDPDCLHLLDIITNYLIFPKNNFTPLRFYQDDLLYYFEAFIICKNSIDNGYTLPNFHVLLNRMDNFKKIDTKKATMNIILKCFNQVNFYISEQDELILRNKVQAIYPQSEISLDMFDIRLANSRQQFINMNDSSIENEHAILKDARIRMSTFTQEQLIIDEHNYKYIAISNLLSGIKGFNHKIDISVRQLIKFRAHIISLGMPIFGVNIKELQELEVNNLFNDLLAQKLIGDGYLDYGRNLNLDIGNNKIDKAQFIEACIKYTKEIFYNNSFLKIEFNPEVFRSSLNDILDDILKSRKIAKDALQGFVLKDAVSMLFVTQREQCLNPQFMPEQYKDCLLDAETNKSIRHVLRDLTELTLRLSDLFTSQNGVINISGYRATEKIAEELTSAIEKGKSLIIPCGSPMKPDDKESKHFFYILIKNCSENKVKLIIVNGGDTIENAVDVDYSFSDVDSKSAGNNWLCRETEIIDTSIPEQRNFIKEYMHRALILPYTKFIKDTGNPQNKKTLLENINLLTPEFTGFGYVPLDFVPKILPIDERSYSMPSQLFGNCTIYNLQFAIRFLFDWNEAQFTQFIHDTYIRYNCFLHEKVNESVLYYKEENQIPGAHSVYQIDSQDLAAEKVNIEEKMQCESKFIRIRSQSFESISCSTEDLYRYNKLSRSSSEEVLYTPSYKLFKKSVDSLEEKQDKNNIGMQDIRSRIQHIDDDRKDDSTVIVDSQCQILDVGKAKSNHTNRIVDNQNNLGVSCEQKVDIAQQLLDTRTTLNINQNESLNSEHRSSKEQRYDTELFTNNNSSDPECAVLGNNDNTFDSCNDDFS